MENRDKKVDEFYVKDVSTLAPVERIEKMILVIRGEKMMLDADLAELYGVSTSYLNKAVSRNTERFPEDFMFQLTKDEFENLKFQFGTSSWGGTRKLPRAFTEQGVAMLSGVLRSPVAVAVNIEIMRAFVRQRKALAVHEELTHRVEALERRSDAQERTTAELSQVVFQSFRQLEKPVATKPVKESIAEGEGERIEFKETFEYNIRTEQRDERMICEVVEAVAGFMNKNGGDVLIGVSRMGEIKGLDRDFSLRAAEQRTNDDFELHLRNHLQSKLEPYIPGHVFVQFDSLPEGLVCSLHVTPVERPVYLFRNNRQEFRVRDGNRTIEIEGQRLFDYLNEHFRNR